MLHSVVAPFLARGSYGPDTHMCPYRQGQRICISGVWFTHPPICLAVIADTRYLQIGPVTLSRKAFVNKTNKIFLLIQSPGPWWGGGSGKP